MSSPMNIVYLCANPGLDLEKMLGPKIHIQAILRGLKTRDVNATLVAVQKPDSIKGYEEFETVILPHRYMRGFVHRIIPYTGIVDSLHVFLRIVALNRTKRITLIHERYTGLSWGGVLTAKFLRIPLVVHLVGPGIEEKAIQGNPIKPSKKWFLLLNQKYILSNCDHLILVSKLIASFIYQKRGWKLPINSVLSNGADIPQPLTLEEKTTIRRQFDAENQPLFLYSGSLYRWYDSLGFVKAFHRALSTHPDLKLMIIGSGDAENDIRDYIHANILQNSVCLAGNVAHNEIKKIVQAVDYCLVFYPGEPTYFGSSTKVMEYMALGKPVISTPHMLEIIDDGITGYMTKTSSPDDFAAKIIEVANNPEQARAVGENARRKIASGFLWQHYIQHLIDIYRSVMDNY
ncbi:MAG: glycosyltransferase family 4 protein [Candidatus Neomarinimicrobiota bacterium]